MPGAVPAYREPLWIIYDGMCLMYPIVVINVEKSVNMRMKKKTNPFTVYVLYVYRKQPKNIFVFFFSFPPTKCLSWPSYIPKTQSM